MTGEDMARCAFVIVIGILAAFALGIAAGKQSAETGRCGPTSFELIYTGGHTL